MSRHLSTSEQYRRLLRGTSFACSRGRRGSSHRHRHGAALPRGATTHALPADATVQVAQVPRRFPATVPLGCALPPDKDRWSSLSTQVDECDAAD
eukprot:5309291-Pyramimonas_sp.AAC.1